MSAQSEGAEIRQRSLAEELNIKSRRQVNADPRVTSDESDLDQLLRDEDRIADRTKLLPQGSDHMGALIDPLLSRMNPRWRNWVVRGVFSILMITGFTFAVRMGPIWLMFLVFAIQFKCFHEIISIGLAVYRLYDFPMFRSLSWWFLFASNYFFFGESLIEYFGILLRRDNFLGFLVGYHRLISFGFYCGGFVWFVLTLQKGYYMRQFSLFAWTHVCLLLVVSQSFLIIQNIFQGIIWFLVPVALVICCDVMSYMFGFFWGKTPLIKLSPKKTWEGFIGGAFSTIAFGLFVPYAFRLHGTELPRPLSWLMKIVRSRTTLDYYPFLVHSIWLSLFASLLGPFGGFFASGFKRAFKIKDFGDVIPGHGGLMDRFDCQLLMGTFVNVYIHTFIRVPNPGKLLQQISLLSNEDQLTIYQTLQQKLQYAELI